VGLGGGFAPAEAAAVGAIASGSQHSNIKAISHRIARSLGAEQLRDAPDKRLCSLVRKQGAASERVVWRGFSFVESWHAWLFCLSPLKIALRPIPSRTDARLAADAALAERLQRRHQTGLPPSASCRIASTSRPRRKAVTFSDSDAIVFCTSSNASARRPWRR
jgi:hypothetical protein